MFTTEQYVSMYNSLTTEQYVSMYISLTTELLCLNVYQSHH